MQKLQAARRDLALEAALAKLDRFDLIILDDIGYAQKDHAETSVLFELIDSYRRRAAAARNPTTTTGDSPDRTAATTSPTRSRRIKPPEPNRSGQTGQLG